MASRSTRSQSSTLPPFIPGQSSSSESQSSLEDSARPSQTLPEGVSLRAINPDGEIISVLPHFDKSEMKNALALNSSKFSGDPADLSNFLRAKKRVVSSDLDYFVAVVLSLEGNALRWWDSHPYDYDGSTASVRQFLTNLRSAFHDVAIKQSSHRELMSLRLTLTPGAWTVFRSRFLELVHILRVNESYAVVILMDALPTTLIPLLSPGVSRLPLLSALENIELVFNASLETQHPSRQLAKVPSTPAPEKPPALFCSHHQWCNHTTEQCHFLRKQNHGETPKIPGPPEPPNASEPAKPSTPSASGERAHPRCFVCGSRDHMASKCPSRAGSSFHMLRLRSPSEEFNVMVRIGPFSDVPALVDTGASSSFISPPLAEELNVQQIPSSDTEDLKLGNMQAIPAPPISSPVEIQYGAAVIQHSFYVLQTGYPVILGANLLKQLGITLVYSPVALRAPNVNPVIEVSEEVLSEPHPQRALIVEDPRIASLLAEVEAIRGFCTHPAAVFSVELKEVAKPCFRHQYPVPLAYRPFVDKAVEDWLAAGVIRHAIPGNPWNLPLTTAPKRLAGDTSVKTGRRVCIDPTALNPMIEDIHFPLPRIADLLQLYSQEGGVFSLIDLHGAYNSILMDEFSQTMLTFTWKNSRYSFVSCPFGVKTIPAFFQRLMSIIFDGVSFVGLYIDDIVVFSKTIEEHIEHVVAVLGIIKEANLRTNAEKCQLGFTKLKILGHVVSRDEIHIDRNKLPFLESVPMPCSGHAVEAFLGFTNYFRAHIPMYARLAAPLERLRKVKSFEPRPDDLKAFNDLKAAVGLAVPISTYVEGRQLFIACDASTRGLGAILFQLDTDVEVVSRLSEGFCKENPRRKFLSITSRALTPAERNYSATALEMQAVCFALQKFHHFILGRKIIVITDHMSLTKMMMQPKLSSHVERNLETLLSYDIGFIHISGVQNILPDALSRMYDHLTEEEFHLMGKSDQQLMLLSNPGRSFNQLVEEVAGKRLPGPEERERLLASCHDIHQGPQAMFKRLLLNEEVYWPSMLKDCQTLVNSCSSCQMFASKTTGYQPLRSVPSYRPFDSVSIDYFGPLPTSLSGASYVLVIVDDFSGFIILRPIEDKSAIVAARSLWSVYADYGVPMRVRSDRGTEFVNQLVAALHRLMGVDHRVTAPYHPNANGKAESSVKLAKTALKKLAHDNWVNWNLFIPTVQMGLNQRIPSRTNTAPFVLLFGRPFNRFADYSDTTKDCFETEDWLNHFREFNENILGGIRARMDEYDANIRDDWSESHRVTDDFVTGSLVKKVIPQTNSKLTPNWSGPYRVIKKSKSGSYVIQDMNGNILDTKVPHEQLKLLQLPGEFPSGLQNEPTSSTSISQFVSGSQTLAKRKRILKSLNSQPPNSTSAESSNSHQDLLAKIRQWKQSTGLLP